MKSLTISYLNAIDSPTLKRTPPIHVSMELDDRTVRMEVDTGAAYSLVSSNTFKELWPDRKLNESTVKLCTYSGESLEVLGSITVQVTYQSQKSQELLLVVKGNGPTLLGRNWLHHIVLDWQQINQVLPHPVQSVLQKHKVVFQEGLGALQGYQAKIIIDHTATPRFHKARAVPYAYRELVEKELDRLVQEGTLEPVEFVDWTSPIVPVLKKDKNSVRICGDFKQTINPVSRLDRYPIPKVEDLFTSLSGEKLFSKIDLSQAYQQVPLEESSRKYVVINTHKGLLQYTRLPFGVSSAPGIFQRVMETILQGIPGVIVYIDNILIAGANEEEHLQRLDEVLTRLEKAGLRAHRSKCEFMVKSVTFLGHRIDGDGLHPLSDKVDALKNAPAPCNTRELKSYLGLLSYYSKYLSNLSSVLAPLYELLCKDVKWKWSTRQEEAFKQSKELLTSTSLLVHFDPTLPLVLACDASEAGIGAVLAHKFPDGSERPIGYASRSLSKAEKNYSQLEKEGLSCVFGVKKFHSYLLGHRFLLYTDHKPLLALLNAQRSTSPQASARIRRWSLLLSTYEYDMEFRDTLSHANADALSRLPLLVCPPESEPVPEMILLMEHLKDSPVSSYQIRTATARDPLLAVVLRYIRSGWPSNVPASSNLFPFFCRRAELSVQDGCILWGSRIIIPSLYREAVLLQLHEAHPGITKMKSLARLYVWWPGIDKEIEKSVKQCRKCQQTQVLPPSAPLHPWKWPSRPWTRLHIDYCGPISGKMVLVVVDSHSKWIEAFPVYTANSQNTIENLRPLFAQFGLPETIGSDNAAYFLSDEFESFLRQNGINHPTSSAYHPASNGLAERAVQTLKQGLKKVQEGSLVTRIAKVLFTYRITQHSTTGRAPAELLLGKIPRTRLDLMMPRLEERVERKQWQQKDRHDRSAKARTFSTGDTVLVRNFPSGRGWIRGTITKPVGPVSYQIKLENGRVVKRHQDHVRPRSDTPSSDKSDFPHVPIRTPTDLPPNRQQEQVVEQERVPRYPSRNRNPPNRLTF